MKKAKPFVKWVGGKNQLLEQFEQYYPNDLKNGCIKKYVEPFLGGGALYFSISEKYNIRNAYLSDLNKDLILTYHVIQQKAECLLDFLKQYQDDYDNTEQEKRNDLFLSVRKHFNFQRFEINYNKLSDNWIPRAAQFVFLNKTCFNGLFRLNSKGEFNVPYGKYKTATILDEENILAVSDVLQNATITQSKYTSCFSKVDEDTFVYFDPPYRPITQTSSFTTYTGTEFCDAQQIELAVFFQKLDKEKNARLMLSNSDPTNINPADDFFEKAYKGYNIFKVFANRAVNCNGAKRGKINELLITNYKDISK
ncbi:MAG: Dam family site-specific DNA-(adenine-N6)-methyltransferase [Planctomycetaceae bacterium]|jgi:DNA adenine methylase|nr:Dam family site-specific DNA-(adenine-N6)-methyltransferase [Planctomycetaceae bacterium]